MTRTLLALLVASALATPASAGGTISLSITADTPRELRTVLRAMAQHRQLRETRGRSTVAQNGVANTAALQQHGPGHRGLIRQNGDGHEASLTQTGSQNTFGIVQFGSGAEAHVTQTGNGQAGLLLQYGF